MDKQLHERVRILAICCLSLFIVGLDITVVNVALPAIGRDLDAGISGLQWTVGAYTVVLASLLLLSGSTADRFGRKRVFVVGLAVFSVASLLCSVAPNVELLVVFRVLQIDCRHAKQVAGHHRVAFGHQFKALPFDELHRGVHDRLGCKPMLAAVLQAKNVAGKMECADLAATV